MSASVLLRTGTTLSQKLGIPASGANHASYVQDDGKNKKSSVLHCWEPWPALGPDGGNFETLVK